MAILAVTTGDGLEQDVHGAHHPREVALQLLAAAHLGSLKALLVQLEFNELFSYEVALCSAASGTSIAGRAVADSICCSASFQKLFFEFILIFNTLKLSVSNEIFFNYHADQCTAVQSARS